MAVRPVMTTAVDPTKPLPGRSENPKYQEPVDRAAPPVDVATAILWKRPKPDSD